MDQAVSSSGTTTTTNTPITKKPAKRRSKKQSKDIKQEQVTLVDHLAHKLQITERDAAHLENQENIQVTNINTNGLHNGLSSSLDSEENICEPDDEQCERLKPKEEREYLCIPPVPVTESSEYLENGHPASKVDRDQIEEDDIQFECYQSEVQMAEIMRLIQKDLSEPYSIYTYRYFIYNWPKLCFLAMHKGHYVGAIVCKLDKHHINIKRGYIAMLAVDEKYRKRKIGSRLVRRAITAMITNDADEVVLETEITNKPALRLYENLGFVRDKRLFRYYLNGVDALRLKLWLR